MRTFLLFSFLVCWIPSLIAQDEGLTDTDQVKSGYRVSLFDRWGGPELYYQGKKDEYFELKAYEMSYSKTLPFKKGEPIVFYTQESHPEEGVIYKPYMKTSLPPEITEPLIVLYWSQSKQKGVSQVLEFSHRLFPSGAYQFVNLGKTPILGYVREKKERFQSQPLKSKIVRQKIADGEVVPIEMVTQKEEQRIVVYSSVVKHRAARRVIFFLYPEVNSLGRTVYRVKLLEDFSQAES